MYNLHTIILVLLVVCLLFNLNEDEHLGYLFRELKYFWIFYIFSLQNYLKSQKFPIQVEVKKKGDILYGTTVQLAFVNGTNTITFFASICGNPAACIFGFSHIIPLY